MPQAHYHHWRFIRCFEFVHRNDLSLSTPRVLPRTVYLWLVFELHLSINGPSLLPSDLYAIFWHFPHDGAAQDPSPLLDEAGQAVRQSLHVFRQSVTNYQAAHWPSAPKVHGDGTSPTVALHQVDEGSLVASGVKLTHLRFHPV